MAVLILSAMFPNALSIAIVGLVFMSGMASIFYLFPTKHRE